MSTMMLEEEMSFYIQKRLNSNHTFLTVHPNIVLHFVQSRTSSSAIHFFDCSSSSFISYECIELNNSAFSLNIKQKKRLMRGD
jgi:hypothetical protein